MKTRNSTTELTSLPILTVVTLAAFLCVFTGVVGLCGALLNSRPILAIYSFLLWPTLISILVVGYTSYKRANLRLDRKLNMAWSRYFDDLARLRLQNNVSDVTLEIAIASKSNSCFQPSASMLWLLFPIA